MKHSLEIGGRRILNPSFSLILISLVLILVCGCKNTLNLFRPADCAFVPVASEALSKDAGLHARIQMELYGRTIGIEVIAEKKEDALIVIGLSPHGSRLFSINQKARIIQIDAGSSKPIELVAQRVMDALHRGHWILPIGNFPKSGRSEWLREGEWVTEEREEGLLRREYRHTEKQSNASRIAIDYRGPFGTNSISRVIPTETGGYRIENPTCGYEAVVVLLPTDRP